MWSGDSYENIVENLEWPESPEPTHLCGKIVASSCLKMVQRLQLRQVTYKIILLPLRIYPWLTIKLMRVKSWHKYAMPAKTGKEWQESL